jgi:hypothetical protein
MMHSLKEMAMLVAAEHGSGALIPHVKCGVALEQDTDYTKSYILGDNNNSENCLYVGCLQLLSHEFYYPNGRLDSQLRAVLINWWGSEHKGLLQLFINDYGYSNSYQVKVGEPIHIFSPTVQLSKVAFDTRQVVSETNSGAMVTNFFNDPNSLAYNFIGYKVPLR